MNDMHTVRKESFKTHVPHRFPEDNCVYHAFDTESTLKKMLCGTPTQINLKDGINIFEIPVPQIALDPYTLNSENFLIRDYRSMRLLAKIHSFFCTQCHKNNIKNGKKSCF